MGIGSHPGFGAAFYRGKQVEKRAVASLGDKNGCGGDDAAGIILRYRGLKFILFTVAFAFLRYRRCRPADRLGKMEEEKRKGADLMILLDVSNSMLSQDMAPNRLENAKQAIAQLIDNLHQTTA